MQSLPKLQHNCLQKLKDNFQFQTITQKPRIVKTILNNKINAGDIIPDLVYDRAILIKIA